MSVLLLQLFIFVTLDYNVTTPAVNQVIKQDR